MQLWGRFNIFYEKLEIFGDELKNAWSYEDSHENILVLGLEWNSVHSSGTILNCPQN
jgi:hypothetical protein